MMTDEPIPIKKDLEDLTGSEAIRYMKMKHDNRIQWAFMSIVIMVVLAVLVPLTVFTVRIASGG